MADLVVSPLLNVWTHNTKLDTTGLHIPDMLVLFVGDMLQVLWSTDSESSSLKGSD